MTWVRLPLHPRMANPPSWGITEGCERTNSITALDEGSKQRDGEDTVGLREGKPARGPGVGPGIVAGPNSTGAMMTVGARKGTRANAISITDTRNKIGLKPPTWTANEPKQAKATKGQAKPGPVVEKVSQAKRMTYTPAQHAGRQLTGNLPRRQCTRGVPVVPHSRHPAGNRVQGAQTK